MTDTFDDVAALEDALSQPSQALIDTLATVPGDIMVLGVGGKMGPTLARMARRAAPDKKVIGVARFSEAGLRQRLEGQGIEWASHAMVPMPTATAAPRGCTTRRRPTCAAATRTRRT